MASLNSPQWELMCLYVALFLHHFLFLRCKVKHISKNNKECRHFFSTKCKVAADLPPYRSKTAATEITIILLIYDFTKRANDAEVGTKRLALDAMYRRPDNSGVIVIYKLF